MSKRHYLKFSPEEDFSDIDYIVVGSGLGGLTVAIFLAKAGKKVLVLEQHFVPGGFSHTFKRKNGFVWDVGVHYVGNVGNRDSQLRLILDYITDRKLKWASMGEVYDKAIFGEEVYEFPAGRENLRTQLHQYFPEEKEAIDGYLDLVKQTSSAGMLFFIEKTFPSWFSKLFGRFFKRKFNNFASKSTYDTLRELTQNEKLISVLCSQFGDYGLPPQKSSFGVHAVVIDHFMGGGFYPVGGAAEIYLNMIQVLNQHGGKVRIHANVEEIIVKKNRVQGVQVNGKFIACKKVISNAGARNTFTRLLKNEPSFVTEKLKKINPATSHMCLYIGLDQDAETLHLPKHNIWYYKDYDIDTTIKDSMSSPDAPLSFAYISFPSAKDPNWNPGTATLQAMGIGNYEWVSDFEDTSWKKRGEKYEALKMAFQEKMLQRLYLLFPQIKGHVVCTDVSTPLTTRHFTQYQTGEIYGLEHSPERFQLDALRPETSIKGLSLVGQDVVTVGVGGAITSGLLCAIPQLKFRIIKQIRAMGEEKAID